MELTVHIGGFGQMFGVPNRVVDQYLKLATPSQLKILLYILRHSDQPIDTQEIANALSISEELIEEALMFWEQTDLFQKPEFSEKTATKKTAKSASTTIKSSTQVATLAGSKHGELSPAEIATALDKSDDLKMLFRMSEQQMGRPLRHVEQKALVWMHDYNNIGSDIILTVLLYCKSIDKCSVSYAESIVTAWWNEGIQTLAQVNEAINEMERRRSFTGHIRKAFEMHRNPTPKQQEFIDQWREKNIPIELITYAYEKTIEGADKLSFPYLNTILMRWMDAGYRTRTDVDTKDRPPAGGAESKKAINQKKVPESENAQAYKSFIFNIDE